MPCIFTKRMGSPKALSRGIIAAAWMECRVWLAIIRRLSQGGPMSLAPLLERLADIHNLDMANAVLNWDQRTYMPEKGGDARAKQLATLAKLSHEMLVARETQDLLAAAEAQKFPAD